MTLKAALNYGKTILEAENIPDAALDSWYLLEFITQESRATYFGNPEKEMENLQWEVYKELIMKRSTRIPLQHITGVAEFMGYIFTVNDQVLIPRQDTEILVEKTLEQVEEGMKILDMCTGSGCIIISIKKICESRGINISATGVDISKGALEVATENQQINHTCCQFIHSDLFANVSEKYQIIVSNPPYIPTAIIEELEAEVKFHDPIGALDGKEDGLVFYREIVKESLNYLEPKGYLLFEIGHDQGEAVSEYMREAGYKEVEVIPDLTGLDRVVMGHL